MAASNAMVSTARFSYPLPALTSMGALAELPLTPRLTRAQIDTAIQTDLQKSGYVALGQEKRALPRPDWFPQIGWKTAAVFAAGGLLLYFAVR